MSKKSRHEIMETVRWHYQRSTSKAEKGELLDRLCGLLGWERKHAIKVLRGHRGAARAASRGGPLKGRRGGARCRYQAADIGLLKNLWFVSGQPCGKRLKPVLKTWLASWERKHGPCAGEVRSRVLDMSAAQIDRRLADFKSKGRGRKPGPLNEVRAQIPVRTGPWSEQGAGWIEADTVAHCGGDMSGLHAWSVVMTDIASGWTTVGMVLGRHDLVMRPCVAGLEASLPFGIVGVDTDNGSEFVNHTLLRYWRQRQRPVQVSRSRPYKKNDNAHVEQKNRTKVRELLGHGRIDCPGAVDKINEALRQSSLLDNLFKASMKLTGKTQQPGGRWRKHYEKTAQTPCQRLLAMDGQPEERRKELAALLEGNDPLSLEESVQALLKEGWNLQREWEERRAEGAEAKRDEKANRRSKRAA